jgi:flagellar FliL protein
MADKEEEKKEGEATEKSGGSKKIIIIAVVAVLLLAAIGAGVFFALSSGKSEGSHDAAEEEVSEEAVDEHAAGGAVLPLETFIVNLQVKGSFLKTSIQLEFAEPQLPPTMEKDVPKVRDAIIRILSSKAAADILSVEGKEALREDLIEAINQSLGSEDVVDAYFTEFIIQ